MILFPPNIDAFDALLNFCSNITGGSFRNSCNATKSCSAEEYFLENRPLDFVKSANKFTPAV